MVPAISSAQPIHATPIANGLTSSFTLNAGHGPTRDAKTIGSANFAPSPHVLSTPHQRAINYL